MRLHSQSPTTTSSSAPQTLPTAQNSTGSAITAKNAVQQAPRSKFRKRLPALHAVLLVSAVALSGVEAFRYVSQGIEHRKIAQYFVYTGYFPQAAAYSPNGKYLAVCTPIAEETSANSANLKGSIIELHDPHTGKKIKSTYTGTTRFDSLSFSKDGNYLYALSSSSKTICIFNLSTGELRRILLEGRVQASALNTADNSVVSIYKDKIRVQGLDNSVQREIPLPKNKQVLDGRVTGVMFSTDSRFISWTAYSDAYKKKVLRLADTKNGLVFDLQTVKDSGIPMEAKLPFSIVPSSDIKTIYLSGNVHKSTYFDAQKSSYSYDFSHGIAEVDLESGKIKRSQHQYTGIGVSHVRDNVVFLKNARQETSPLLRWDRPLDTMPSSPNTIAVSPDGRWQLTYHRDGLKRERIKP